MFRLPLLVANKGRCCSGTAVSGGSRRRNAKPDMGFEPADVIGPPLALGLQNFMCAIFSSIADFGTLANVLTGPMCSVE